MRLLTRVKRTVIVAFVTALSIPFSGCAIGPHPVTYLIPTPSVPGVTYPREEIAHEHTGVQTICFAPTSVMVAPPNRDMASFNAGAAKFCYLSPTVSGQKNNPRQLCESTQAPDPIDSPMTFVVFVAGDGISVDQASGILQANGQMITEPATVQSAQTMATKDGLNYELTRWDLTFVFKQQCDPNQQYQLTVRGIKYYGREIQAPLVDFSPFTERFPMGRN
jgi:hypothetical protein